ncbi:unnamed protein product [Scytosiphon promiscuus]
MMYITINVPKKMWGSLADRRNGVGYFADPLGKPSLLTYWTTLIGFSYTCVFSRPKRPTEDALLAAGERTLTKATTTAASTEWADDGVTIVDKGSYLAFSPPTGDTPVDGGDKGAPTSGSPPLVGIIILPGALIPPTAYAPLARSMAQRGHPTFIVRFDFNLATEGWQRIGEIVPTKGSETAGAAAVSEGDQEDGKDEGSESFLDTTPMPTKWVLAGHSMGTVAIERFYPGNPDSVHGVVYMGSGNMIGDVMTGAEVPAMVLRGSRDPFCPEEALKKSAHKLPKDTETVVIEGGNHRGFGSYGWQPLDWEATISLREQRCMVVDALAEFIDRRVVATC